MSLMKLEHEPIHKTSKITKSSSENEITLSTTLSKKSWENLRGLSWILIDGEEGLI
jgi:hypothetical protein